MLNIGNKYFDMGTNGGHVTHDVDGGTNEAYRVTVEANAEKHVYHSSIGSIFPREYQVVWEPILGLRYVARCATLARKTA